jgi:hypothetical protein
LEACRDRTRPHGGCWAMVDRYLQDHGGRCGRWP